MRALGAPLVPTPMLGLVTTYVYILHTNCTVHSYACTCTGSYSRQISGFIYYTFPIYSTILNRNNTTYAYIFIVYVCTYINNNHGIL